MPKALTVTLANLVYFEKAELPQPLANRLIRLAAFQNPEFYKAQAMRMSVWDKPRVIGCAESYPQHIALPRGCLDAALSLLRENGIACDLRDERFGGHPALLRMWHKRQRGYRAMGYRIEEQRELGEISEICSVTTACP